MQKQVFTLDLGEQTLTAELSDLTEQAGGSVLMRSGETAVLVTVVMGDTDEPEREYMPLTVEFEERFYAAGTILGNRFQRREGRPSEQAILSARMIDRTIRPLFPKHLRREVQVIVTVLAQGEEASDVLGIIGTSLALSLSPIPWRGPVGAARISKRPASDAFHVDTTIANQADQNHTFTMLACGKNNTINMIEAACHEAREEEITEALKQVRAIHTKLINWQEAIVATAGVTKIPLPEPVGAPAMEDLFHAQFAQTLDEALFSGQAGTQHIAAVHKAFVTAVQNKDISSAVSPAHYITQQTDQRLHNRVLHTGIRPDGRTAEQVRSLYAQAGGVSPVLHGSGIFYRGGTHIFSALTLGGPDDVLHIDTIETQNNSKRFMHHYNFPPFSVGETGRVSSFNRRSIGHGILAEKALVPVLPPKETFPYTIRLVSETMAANGSSSMGSVCASSLALMDGGVPISRPVAGIAIGLLQVDDAYCLLTDIQGPEDAYGDMDFKVAGTEQGITAMQMDVKVDGVPITILTEALSAARIAREEILTVIQETLSAPRPHVSDRVPYIERYQIEPAQIGLVIGSGGKTVNAIKERSGVNEISIEDDGTIYIIGNKSAVATALHEIQVLTKIYAIGDTYEAHITSLTHYGAFAQFDDGNAQGLIHISEIAPHHVETVEAVLAVGDEVPVCIIKNDRGKIGLSIKEADPDRFKKRNF